jgi:hypothetical protein
LSAIELALVQAFCGAAKFCSSACRQRAYRRRVAPEASPSNTKSRSGIL